VPILGNLFRYDNRKRVKTNLLVFLRPVVLRNAEASFGVTADRYDYIRQLQGTSAVTPSELIPERQFMPPAMSPMPPRPGQPGVAPPSVSPAINDAMPDRWRPVAPRPPSAPVGGAAPGAPQPPAPVIDVRPGAPAPSGMPALPPPGGQPGASAPQGGVVQTAPNEIVIRRTPAGPIGGDPATGIAN
jgi:general secretion pathway protein D